jgi:hypothetical protein
MSFNTGINSNYAIFNLIWDTLNSDISFRQIQLLYGTQTIWPILSIREMDMNFLLDQVNNQIWPWERLLGKLGQFFPAREI